MEAATRKGRQGKDAEKVWRGRARFQNQGDSFREGLSAHARAQDHDGWGAMANQDPVRAGRHRPR